MQARCFEIDCVIDPLAVGAVSGMLWRSPEVTLAGVGEAAKIVPAETVAALAALGPQAIALGALPFDATLPGAFVIPEILLRRDADGALTLTIVDDGRLSLTDSLARLEDLATAAEPPAPPHLIRSPIAAEVWRDKIVVEAIDRIRRDELTKVVLAREIIAKPLTQEQLPGIVTRLAGRFPTAYLFSLGGFIGASPELLIERRGDEVRAHPLAGTTARGATPEADAALGDELLASAKNRWEHQITIDWFLDNLLPYCSYVDAEPEPTLVSLANVHHLGTKVEGRLSSPPASVLELVATLHPTPAVGGAPQRRAIEVIAEIEGIERGRYGGPVGWVDGAGNGAFAVGIRSAQLDVATEELRIYAGVGVVADSDPASELAETEAKFAAILSALPRQDEAATRS